MTNRDALIWLNHLEKLDTVRKQALLDIFEPEEILEFNRQDIDFLKENTLITPAAAEELLSQEPEKWLEKHMERVSSLGMFLLVMGDPDYPAQLENVETPPLCIYGRGDKGLLGKPSMAVIGARTPSLYGSETAGYFASRLAAAGVVIVSGLAAGIDGAAHKAALAAGGSTVGVLGCGVNLCYPKENFGLYDRMCREGTVISEYGPDVLPFAGHFPQRNRIISGLSRGVLVTEARRKSGTMITAEAALEQGRSIYAVPGRLMDPLSAGTNHLIQTCALLADSPEEILQDLFPELTRKGKKKKEELTEEEDRILKLFSLEPVCMDDVIRKGKKGISETISLIQSLEKKKRIRETLPGYYILETKIFSCR